MSNNGMWFSRFFIVITAPLLLGHCAQQKVTQSLGYHTHTEAARYADEVASQSPFKKVTMTWTNALQLMEERNLAYTQAKRSLYLAKSEIPQHKMISEQVKKSVKFSFGDILKPQTVAMNLQDPITSIPKQLISISALKDIPHELEQTIWKKESDFFQAKLKMREELVRFFLLLNKGDIINQEIAEMVDKSNQLAESTEKLDDKLSQAQKDWQKSVLNDHAEWITEVRDFFNAEYQDIIFIKDSSAKPNYQGEHEPDLSDGQRWCLLSRSQSVVNALKEKHKTSKPRVPGTREVKEKVDKLFNRRAERKMILDQHTVRSDVRQLISNWRKMKETEAELRGLVRDQSQIDNPYADLQKSKKIYQLRHQAMIYTSAVWMLDENCW